MNKFYGGGGVERGRVCWSPAAKDVRRSCEALHQPSNWTASTYTPEEARYAEQYAKDACADSPASDDRHYRSFQ